MWLSFELASNITKSCEKEENAEILSLISDANNAKTNKDFLYLDISEKDDCITFIPNKIEYRDSILFKISTQNTIGLTHNIFKNIFSKININDVTIINNESNNINDTYKLLGIYDASDDGYSNYSKMYSIIHFENTVNKKQVVILNSLILSESSNTFEIVSLGKCKKNEIKIGRFVNKLSDSLSGKKVESFVNSYKSHRILMKSLAKKLEIVKGDDIKKWYDSEKYAANTGILSGSCMAIEQAQLQNFFKLYTDNDNVSMLILKDDNDKLIGRALLWENTSMGKYMDRAYGQDHIIKLFEKWAINNEYISYNSNLFDMTIDVNIDLSNKFAYSDTFRYMTTENDLNGTQKATLSTKRASYTNDERYNAKRVLYYTLESTSGHYQQSNYY